MKKRLAMAILCVSFVLPIGNANAGMILSGSINSTENGGMYATESWADGGAVLSFAVTSIGNLWEYVYNFNVDRKDLSHIIFEVSDSFTAANIFEGTTAGWSLGNWGAEGNSNPGILDTLYGLKFDGNFSLSNILTVVTDKPPMWGDFYAKDGKDGGDWVFAYNTNYGVAMDPYQDFAFGKVLVPNTYANPVPAPAPLALLGCGLLGMAVLRRRRSVTPVPS